MSLAGARESPRILQSFVPSMAGGLESVVVALACGLQEAGVPVAVSAMVDPDGALPHSVGTLREAGVEVFCHAPVHRAYLRERGLHAATIHGWGADLVHTHGYRADLLAGSAAARLGRRRVSTVHGFTGGDWKNRLYERLQLRAFRRFDEVIAVSRPIRARLLSAGVPDSVLTVVPNAWSPARPPLSREAARAALGIASDAKLVGWIGRLSREKGADLLMEAVPLLPDAAITVSLLGDGAERDRLAAQAAALGISARVRWHGVVPDAGAFAAAFDCFVLSSRTEGTPIVLLEAMAAGTPIVATAVGGVPDVVTPAEAALVPPEDPGAIARAIVAVLDASEAAAQRAARARQRLTERHALGPWIDRHREIYGRILAGQWGAQG